MVKLFQEGAYLVHGTELIPESEAGKVEQLTGRKANREEAVKGTIAYNIMKEHNVADQMDNLKIKFDCMASHDITFVGIVQTAKASGMEKFPIPYVLTNCHNSLCAVGGTINEDDHMFGLSAAQKYGGIYVPPHIAVIHQFMRENMAGCGRMILGSDSHTRYGALGTMAIGEGGGELVKQLLCDTYDVKRPDVIAVYLDGKPAPWIGPQDIALAIIGAVFKNGYVKNKVMEFVGPGVSEMTTDYRNGIDVMTTETTCLSSIWRTDEDTEKYLEVHGRKDAYKELNPQDVAFYDGVVYVDLSSIKPMIALPFHPSNTYTIDELNANLPDILRSVEVEAQKVSQGKAEFTLTDKITDRGLFPAGIYRSGQKRVDRRPDGSRCYYSYSILRPMLWRRRYPKPQRSEYPPYDKKLPEQRRLQARKWTDVSSRTDGRTFNCGNCSEWRYFDFSRTA